MRDLMPLFTSTIDAGRDSGRFRDCRSAGEMGVEVES